MRKSGTAKKKGQSTPLLVKAFITTSVVFVILFFTGFGVGLIAYAQIALSLPHAR